MHGMWLHRAALYASAQFSRPTIRFLIILFIVCATLEVVTSQDGFVSINCGASQEQNSTSGFLWDTDSRYIALGFNANTSVNASAPYDTLRYFNDTALKKNCYVFNTTIDFSYLVRASFLYGNYNSLSVLPSFDLLFGANFWANVTFKDAFEIVIHEMIVLATSNTSSVCLGRSKSNDDPFISSLELRRLSSHQSMYSPVHQNFMMKTNSRINFGQKDNSSVRFPDDIYDRIWSSDSEVVNGISTYKMTDAVNITVSNEKSNDFPPSKVMQTSRSPTKTGNMSISFMAMLGPGSYYLAFYFAELNSSTSEHRIMDVYLDKASAVPALDVANLSGIYNTLELFDRNHMVNENYILTLVRNETSKRPPIINAAESYFLQSITSSTFEKDVQAIEIVRSSFNLSTWTGDPCLPIEYRWDWLLCNSTTGEPARVIALNLSNMNLRAEIPSALGDLSALTTIDLHNNSLFGKIPSSLVNLRNLTLLDLRYNNLSGPYPVELNRVQQFRYDGNPDLCTNGTCPSPAPVAAPEPLPAVNDKKLIPLIIGIVTSAVSAVALLVCIVYKCNTKNKKGILGARSAHWPPVPVFTEISKSVEYGKALQAGGTYDIPVFSFGDIQIITNNFANKVAAAGDTLNLYHGVLSDGQEVIVRLLQPNSSQPPMEFLYKVTPLSFIKHKNLLSPMGFCADSDHPMFIYEYLQIESLYGWLHTGKKELLDWKTRLHILQQIAQGMEYLHSCSPSIIHGQLTSTSVYLGDGDAYLVKIADFGIHELSQNADRSPAYLDPEYAVTHRLTEKSDVYSFGVLILEIVSGRIPLGSSTEKDSFNIVEWVRGLHDEGNDEHIPDTCLHGVCNATMVSRIINLALQATEEDANERPTMSKILNELREVNKTETGHHVVFAEPDNPYNSTDSDAPSSSSAMLSEWCEKDLCINT